MFTGIYGLSFRIVHSVQVEKVHPALQNYRCLFCRQHPSYLPHNPVLSLEPLIFLLKTFAIDFIQHECCLVFTCHFLPFSL